MVGHAPQPGLPFFALADGENTFQFVNAQFVNGSSITHTNTIILQSPGDRLQSTDFGAL